MQLQWAYVKGEFNYVFLDMCTHCHYIIYVMETKVYYTYLHIRPDTGDVFYVGIGSDYPGRYARAYSFGKRNNLWKKVWQKNQRNVIVKILNVFDNPEKCFEEEMYLIDHYGRMCNGTGCLVNISKGGEYKAADPKKVAQYTLSGDFVDVWDSAMIASHVYNVSEKTIYAAISKKRPGAGYLWCLYEKGCETTKLVQDIKTRGAKKVYMFDKNCMYIKDFPSVHAVEKEMGIAASSIFKAISGRRPSAGDYLWSYDKTLCNCFTPRGQKVYQYTLSGELIQEHESLNEAVRNLNLPSSTAIRNCFTGRQKQAYGFIWSKTPMFLSQHRI